MRAVHSLTYFPPWPLWAKLLRLTSKKTDLGLGDTLNIHEDQQIKIQLEAVEIAKNAAVKNPLPV